MDGGGEKGSKIKEGWHVREGGREGGRKGERDSAIEECLQTLHYFFRSQPNEDFNHYTESQKKVVNNRVSDLAEFADKMNFTQLYFLKEYLRQ